MLLRKGQRGGFQGSETGLEEPVPPLASAAPECRKPFTGEVKTSRQRKGHASNGKQKLAGSTGVEGYFDSDRNLHRGKAVEL